MYCPRNLKVLFWNARGLRTKLIELKKYLYVNEIDVVCICETFLKSDSTIQIKGYKCISMCRETGRFGGLMIAVRNGIKFVPIALPKTRLLECLGVVISNINVILIYLPGQSNDSKISQHFINDIAALDRNFTNKFILGDYNSRHTSWNCADNNKAGILLNDYMSKSNSFLCPPDSHTYCPVSSKFRPSTIDLLITDARTNHSNPRVINEFYSDHLPVRFTIHSKIEMQEPIPIPCYHLANWEKFRDVLDNSLGPLSATERLVDQAQIDYLVAHITDAIIHARALAIPNRKTNKDHIFIDPELKSLISKRKYHRMRFLRHRNPLDEFICKRLQQLIKSKMTLLKSLNWSLRLKDCTANNGNIYKLIKARRSKYKTPSYNINDEKLHTDKQKAEALSTSFAAAHNNPLKDNNKSFTKKVHKTVSTYLNSDETHEFLKITLAETRSHIRQLKVRKCPGRDGLNGILLKNLSHKAIEYLNNIFNLCLTAGYFPDEWKKAVVIAIPKPGKDHKLVSGYRPISLLSTLSKIFEKSINLRLQKFSELTDCIPPYQFGFRLGHSTSHPLIRVGKYIKTSHRNKQSAGLIALDIEKAFDSVWLYGLLYKLIMKGCPRYLVLIVKSFICNRSFCVRVGTELSNYQSIDFGVPQGSVLSPILYSIYISDFPLDSDCELSLFADDTAVYTRSRFYKTIKNRLSRYHKQIKRYFTKWKIKININKTQAIYCTKRHTKQTATEPLRLDGNDIEWQKSIKYLGCHLDSRLTQIEHIDETLKKTDISIRSLYPMIHRGSGMDTHIKVLIYKLYIRPILSYASPMISMASKTQRKRLQVKENKILRLLLDKPYDYNTLELRKEANIISLDDFMVKITNSFYCKSAISDNELIRAISQSR